MTVLEYTLSWKHLAPTTPDTLSCFPYTTDDPFILEDYPQIYFAANQASLQHKVIEGIYKNIACSHWRGDMLSLHVTRHFIAITGVSHSSPHPTLLSLTGLSDICMSLI